MLAYQLSGHFLAMNISWNIVLLVFSLRPSERSTVTRAVEVMRHYDRPLWSGHWWGSDRTRIQSLSDQMDVVARLWSWTKTKPSRGQSSPAGGWSRLDQLATKGKTTWPRWPSKTTSALIRETGSKTELFINTEQYKITYYQTYLNY